MPLKSEHLILQLKPYCENAMNANPYPSPSTVEHPSPQLPLPHFQSMCDDTSCRQAVPSSLLSPEWASSPLAPPSASDGHHPRPIGVCDWWPGITPSGDTKFYLVDWPCNLMALKRAPTSRLLPPGVRSLNHTAGATSGRRRKHCLRERRWACVRRSSG